jgi:hypothetical protein
MSAKFQIDMMTCYRFSPCRIGLQIITIFRFESVDSTAHSSNSDSTFPSNILTDGCLLPPSAKQIDRLRKKVEGMIAVETKDNASFA